MLCQSGSEHNLYQTEKRETHQYSYNGGWEWGEALVLFWNKNIQSISSYMFNVSLYSIIHDCIVLVLAQWTMNCCCSCWTPSPAKQRPNNKYTPPSHHHHQNTQQQQQKKTHTNINLVVLDWYLTNRNLQISTNIWFIFESTSSLMFGKKTSVLNLEKTFVTTEPFRNYCQVWPLKHVFDH